MNAKSFCLKLVSTVFVSVYATVWPQNSWSEDEVTAELDTLVVTGERVERSVQDTASSVVVFDEQRLSEQAGADRIEQLYDFVPNLQRGESDLGVSIRGQDSTGVLIGANAFLGGTRPRATLQVDGRVLNFNESIYGLTSIWDVEQIEIFRGPQTTTQGRNATAGAIFVETKDPTFETENAAQVVLGNYDTRQASFVLSGPLIADELAARLAVDVREHESWMNYVSPDVLDGADREEDDYATARAKLLYTPSDNPDLEVLTTYTHLDARNPQLETADEPFDDRIQNVQNGALWDTNVDSLTLETTYAINDTWDASVTATYADSRSERFAAPGFGTAVVKAEEYSLESLLRFDAPGSRTRGIVGVAYFTADQDETSDLSAFLGFGDFTDEQQSVGVFGELTYDVTPKLHLTAGGRFQKDSQDRSGSLGPASLDYDNSFDEFLPKVEVAYDLRDNVVIGASAKKGFNPGGTTVSFTTGAIDEFDAETLWSYELFSRANLAGGDLMLSSNLFFTDFTDAQRPLITIVDTPSGPTESTEFANAPSAESYGLELESLWAANPVLRVRAALGFLKTEIKETNLPNDPILGKEFQRAPEVTAALGFNIKATEQLTLDLNARYSASYYSDDANTPELEIDSVTIVDLKASYDFDDLHAFAYVRNATDETYQVWQLRPGNSSLGDPREYGVGLQMTF
ncbi:MAG: TonB-dependent receptor [Pseudomonadota bacterium]